MEKIYIIANEIDEPVRLDSYVSLELGTKSRNYIQKLIKSGNVLVNKKRLKSSYNVQEDDEIEIELPEPVRLDVEPENIPIDVIFEDDDLLIVNKQRGLVVHPAPGNYSGTLVNALLYYCKDSLSSINGVKRPGIVHRIDKDTSGLLVIAKNDVTHQSLMEQFKIHSIEREYQMIVLGNPKEDEYTVDAPIGRNPKDRLKMAVIQGGRQAITHFKVIQRYDQHCHLSACLETGRTHQIRVHSSYKGLPLLGDGQYYGGKFKFKTSGQVLHATKLGFIHPRTNEKMLFTSPLPKYFADIIRKLRMGE